MTRFRIFIVVAAFVGSLIGAGLGYLLAPEAHRYQASANVALLPAANLTTEEASSFWDVLTRGQISRTAAVLYEDPRWLPSAANAAKVPESELTVTSAALPETTMVSVTVTAGSPAAAEAALNDVLTTATAEVTSLTAPYAVKVIWPPKGSATPVPIAGRSQLAVAGALGGLLIGAAVAWFGLRSRFFGNLLSARPRGVVDEVPVPRP